MYSIYQHYNTVNGKSYVGKTKQTPHRRWLAHIGNANNGLESYFARAIRKYGKGAFVCQILTACEANEDANRLEKLWIIALRTYDPKFGYNMKMGGEGGNFSEFSANAHREALRKANLGSKHSFQTMKS